MEFNEKTKNIFNKITKKFGKAYPFITEYDMEIMEIIEYIFSVDKGTYCFTCKSQNLFQGEGHKIDGSWANDRYLTKSYLGKWFCSFKCYSKHTRANPRGLSLADINNPQLKMAWEETPK